MCDYKGVTDHVTTINIPATVGGAKTSSNSGLHLGNDSRGGGKIRFYESKGGNGVKIHVRKQTKSRGVWGHAPQKIFVFLDSLRLLLMHSQVPENDQK